MPRDIKILQTAMLAPATQGRHYQPLFPSVKSLNERLRELFDHRYLTRIAQGISQFGSPIYGVGRAGVPLALAALSEEGIDLTPEDVAALCRQPAPSQINHGLAVADVFSAYCLRNSTSSGCYVVRFLPERLVRFDYEIRDNRTARWIGACFAPDGALVLTRGPQSMSFGHEVKHEKLVAFLEIDLATVELVRFARKIRGFGHVMAGHLAAARTGCDHAVLAIVTVSERRLGRLRSVAEQEMSHRVILTTFADIARDGPSSSWLEAGTGRVVTLRDITGEIGG